LVTTITFCFWLVLSAKLRRMFDIVGWMMRGGNARRRPGQYGEYCMLWETFKLEHQI
jgi:hypothetical protein